MMRSNCSGCHSLNWTSFGTNSGLSSHRTGSDTDVGKTVCSVVVVAGRSLHNCCMIRVNLTGAAAVALI